MFASVLVSLLLSSPVADAANVPKIKNIRIRQNDLTYSPDYRYGIVVTTDSDVFGATATISSDAGEEELDLEEADAWLHGSGLLSAMPSEGTEAELTLYNADSKALVTFGVIFGLNNTKGDKPVPATALVVSNPGGVDVDVLAAALFPGDEGVDFSLDLQGADTWDVAYGQLTLVETVEGEYVCYAYDKDGRTCLKGETKTTTTKTEVELGWDDLGSIYEGELGLVHTGLIEAKVKALDEDGKKLDSGKAKLAAPWSDAGVGISALATDEDPLTSVALTCGWNAVDGTCQELSDGRVVIVSEGWSLDDDLPELAEVAFEDGETWEIPVHSYQLSGAAALSWKVETSRIAGVVVIVKGDGKAQADRTLVLDGEKLLSPDDLATPVCAGGICLAIDFTSTDACDGAPCVEAVVYDPDADGLIGTTTVYLSAYDAKGNGLGSATTTVTYDAEVSAVFAMEAVFVGDPVGTDLQGKVELQGEASAKGKRDTLSKGKFVANIGRDEDGKLALGGQDKDAAAPRGDILIGGEPIDFELTSDDDGDGVIEGPPAVVLRTDSNGKGTRQVATTTNGSPGLL